MLDIFHFIRYHHHLTLHTPFFRKFFYLSWLYVFLCLLTAVAAVIGNMKAEFGNWQTNLTVLRDFIYGPGTAISPPLIVLVVFIILVDLTFKHTLTARVALVFIILLSIGNSIMAAYQPIVMHNFGVVGIALHILVITTPLIITWMAASVLMTRLKVV